MYEYSTAQPGQQDRTVLLGRTDTYYTEARRVSVFVLVVVCRGVVTSLYSFAQSVQSVGAKQIKISCPRTSRDVCVCNRTKSSARMTNAIGAFCCPSSIAVLLSPLERGLSCMRRGKRGRPSRSPLAVRLALAMVQRDEVRQWGILLGEVLP